MLRATVLERGRLVRGDSDFPSRAEGTLSHCVLPRRLYDRLARSEAIREDRGEGSVFRWGRNHAWVGSWVGVLQVPGLQLEILPKSWEGPDEEAPARDIRCNLLEMLLRGGVAGVRARGRAELALGGGNLHDLLVHAFLDRTLFELQRGLDRTYVSEDENLLALRGKLVLSQHLRRNAAQRHRFFCHHEVLTEATPISTRLKQACRVLATRRLPAAAQVKCQQALALLDEVPDRPFLYRDDPIFTRQNERFADVYGFACMVLEGMSPVARGGRVETFSLLFDMQRVYEAYIAKFMASEVMSRFGQVVLRPQSRGYRFALFHDDKERPVLRMAPDLLFVRAGAGSQVRLIIDTKWKRMPAGKAATPSNADLYQLYAYLNRFGCRRAVLLYPLTAGALPRDLHALGRREDGVGTVGLRFVDLNRKLWTREGRQDLADELAAVVEEGLAPGHLQVVEATA